LGALLRALNELSLADFCMGASTIASRLFCFVKSHIKRTARVQLHRQRTQSH
jgi:hypothetical protein